MHALQAGGLLPVDLQDHLVCHVEPGLVVAHGRRRDEVAVFGNANHFDHCHVDAAVEAEPGMLGYVAEVDVHVVQLAVLMRLRRAGSDM